MDQHVTDSIVYIGVDDKSIDLFESQYAVPNGISYNSYVILDEKTAVMDTVDARGTAGWLDNLTAALDAGLWITWWCCIWSPTIPAA